MKGAPFYYHRCVYRVLGCSTYIHSYIHTCEFKKFKILNYLENFRKVANCNFAIHKSQCSHKSQLPFHNNPVPHYPPTYDPPLPLLPLCHHFVPHPFRMRCIGQHPPITIIHTICKCRNTIHIGLPMVCQPFSVPAVSHNNINGTRTRCVALACFFNKNTLELSSETYQ